MRIPNLIPQLLMPREDLFFGLLRNSCRNLHEATIKLLDMLENYEDVEAKAREIKRLEEVGDHLIHEIMKNLHRTFVTPFDREDIAHLGERLDDVVDAVEEVARLLVEYQVQQPTEWAIEMGRIIERAGAVLEQAGEKLHAKGSRLRQILPYTVEVNRLENEADQVTHEAVRELFANEKDPIEVIKWKELYAQLEEATDRCEDAANVLEGIVLKHA